jgi:hypothetical protein
LLCRLLFATLGHATPALPRRARRARRTKLQELHLLLPMVDQPVPDVACGVRLIQVMEDVIEGTRKFAARNRCAHACACAWFVQV